MCGSSTPLSIAFSVAGVAGSCSNTSRPAPAMRLSCKALTSAASSTTVPRAMLISQPWGPSASSTSAFTRWRVALPPGTASTRKSHSAAKDLMSGQ
ncbi:hypothetical protein G6F65_019707 [Rhizopus arrhizus]|nr:hypothetical protein G6F65_019707 [Rhizopus arrhizus]